MAEQLKDCLIVHAASIGTKCRIVNGFGDCSSLWIGKPPDWICHSESISFWIKNAPVWSVQKSPVFIYFIWLDMAIHVPCTWIADSRQR